MKSNDTRRGEKKRFDNRTEITAPAEKSNRKRQERVLESEKNGICMQQHNKNKADSNGKKSGNSSKQINIRSLKARKFHIYASENKNSE